MGEDFGENVANVYLEKNLANLQFMKKPYKKRGYCIP